MYPAIFLDRDGVIIENRQTYVRRWEDVEIYPQALAALVQAKSTPYKLIIVTNQSAVGRGIIPLATAWEVNNRLVETIEHAGGRIDGVFMCPHAPYENCECRKPKPGLLLQAAQHLSLDLSRSVMIGDALSDLLAGQAAGIPLTVLVRTGRGARQAVEANSVKLGTFQTFDTLANAFEDLI
jgi:D-glycero-D-manno-heptose 1,7-bisphosphate phosphatase